MPVQRQIRARLREWFQQHGSKATLARVLDVHPSWVTQYFDEQSTRAISLEQLDKLAQFYQITLPELMERLLTPARRPPLDDQLARILAKWRHLAPADRDLVEQFVERFAELADAPDVDELPPDAGDVDLTGTNG